MTLRVAITSFSHSPLENGKKSLLRIKEMGGGKKGISSDVKECIIVLSSVAYTNFFYFVVQY